MSEITVDLGNGWTLRARFGTAFHPAKGIGNKMQSTRKLQFVVSAAGENIEIESADALALLSMRNRGLERTADPSAGLAAAEAVASLMKDG